MKNSESTFTQEHHDRRVDSNSDGSKTREGIGSDIRGVKCDNGFAFVKTTVSKSFGHDLNARTFRDHIVLREAIRRQGKFDLL